jgi:hypothetical protein
MKTIQMRAVHWVFWLKEYRQLKIGHLCYEAVISWAKQSPDPLRKQFLPTSLNTPSPSTWRYQVYRPSDRRLSAKLVSASADRECRVVSATDPYGRILYFLDQSSYYLFQVAPQLYSRCWVHPVPGPLVPRRSGVAGNRTLTSGSIASNSDHWTTEVVSVCKNS